MSEQQRGHETQQHEEGEAGGAEIDLQDVAQASGRALPDLNLRPLASPETSAMADDTPPGGDVRTVYSADRDPGDPMPATPQPS